MQIKLTCIKCETHFFRPKSQAAKAKYCSKSCHNKSQSTSEVRAITCVSCGGVFNAKADHGNWPKFCSRECFCSKAVKEEVRSCPVCLSQFEANRVYNNADGLRKYCSKECQNEGKRNGEKRDCIYCGKNFYLPKSTAKNRQDESCCSSECKANLYKRELSGAWKGGAFINKQGEKFVIDPWSNKHKIKKYIGEHRLIASNFIGRKLDPQECVIRIDKDPSNNSLDNLYVCSSISDFATRRNGSKPWPLESNLVAMKNVELSLAK